MHEQLPSQSFDNINSNFSSLTVCKCIHVDGDLFSDSDTDFSNPDTLISDSVMFLWKIIVILILILVASILRAVILIHCLVITVMFLQKIMETLICSTQWILAIRMIQSFITIFYL